MRKTISLLVVILLASCDSTPEQVRVNADANIALLNQNYILAKERYKTALELAQKYGDRKIEAIAMYGLGRSHGYLCEYDVGGVAFLISCSGGSGSSLINDAEAVVPDEQMYCLVTGSSSGLLINTGLPISADPDTLACYDTTGVGQITDLASIWAQGWRIEIIYRPPSGATITTKYIFER